MVAITWMSPAEVIAGKGTKTKASTTKAIRDAGLATVGDLLRLYPREYIRRGELSQLKDMTEGELLSFVGEVVSSRAHQYRDRRTGRMAHRLEVVVRSEGESMSLTYFDRNAHTAQWRGEEMQVGRVGLFAGRLKIFRNDWQLTNPESRIFGEGDSVVEMPALVPIYPTVGKVTSWHFEDLVRVALDVVSEVPEILPPGLREQEKLLDHHTALRGIHRPEDYRQLQAARKRLKFDEAFVTQVVLAKRRSDLATSAASPRAGRGGGALDQFDEKLPFSLTAGQRQVGAEIAAELAHEHPMHRLLQGEVGSGKTLVALRAMLQVVDSGGQCALLAPTEVLAQQHHRSITTMLGDLAAAGMLGGSAEATRVSLVTGSLSAKQRRSALLDIASGEAGIAIGTHALLEDEVIFADLGLVVVDEQHRFGVEQRAALSLKSSTPPHVLVMTATPIPRTVAMTVFGDLDTSTLRELPAGRGEVQTNVVDVHTHPHWLERAWERVREEVAAGRQAYIVCPRIDSPEETPEEELIETSIMPTDELLASGVVKVAEYLESDSLRGLTIGLVHGRLSADEKDATMRGFAAGEVDVLVATTVIEVGVDVPNATVMVILDAGQFGVSQLHQLRGRIGRGGHNGLCLLVSGADPESSTRERLDAVARSRDGFELSKVDLLARREGNVLGTQQSGGRSGLRLLSVVRDEEVIVHAREVAENFVTEHRDVNGVPDLAAAVAELEASDEADFMELG